MQLRMPDEIAALLSSDDVQIERDIVYGHGGDLELHLDLARPRELDGLLPAILFMHGGGWSKGNRQAGEAGTMLLAKQGYVAATISYRLAPAACFPAQLHDCKTAVRWLRANASTYGIDADHVGAAGHSAGGHLAALLALTPNQLEFEGVGGHPNFFQRGASGFAVVRAQRFSVVRLAAASPGVSRLISRIAAER